MTESTHLPGDALVPVSAYEPPVTAELVVVREPSVVLEEARRAARALKDVLDAKPKKVIFNDEQYFEFEDWQTLGRFYGVTAKVVQTSFVEYGDVKGFAARAVALRADGAEISQAEAECLTDEARWRSRPVYDWRDTPAGRRKMKVGEEPVPYFMLKSMAQTRSCAKVLRNVLAWVVVLAGYRPTPAEELPTEPAAPVHPDIGADLRQTPPTPRSPRRASRKSSPVVDTAAMPQPTPEPTAGGITEDERRHLAELAKARGLSDDFMRELLWTDFHVRSSKQLTHAQCIEVAARLALTAPPAVDDDELPF